MSRSHVEVEETGDPRAALLPVLTKQNRPYFDGCAAGELRLQCCKDCAAFRFPDSPRCPVCLSADFEWTATSGRGELLSWIVMHQRYFPEFADRVPYPVVWVRLDEGPIMMAGFSGDVAALIVGARMRAVFERVGDRSVPNFTVAR